jgi:uncharacterized membrane protein
MPVQQREQTDQLQALPAQFQQPTGYFAATVKEILKQDDMTELGGGRFQDVKLKITSGVDSGKEITLRYGDTVNLDEGQLVHAGDRVIVVKTEQNAYYIADSYRLPEMFFAFLLFVGLVLYFGRLKGFMSLLGLGLSITVLLTLVVPLIVKGISPTLVVILGSFIITLAGMFLSHGFSRRTSVAVVSTLATLIIAIGLSVLFVYLVGLTGSGSEEAMYFKLDPNLAINLKGLLLGGIIIGTLGVLDDVTTAQVASVDEIRKANESLSARELYRRGISVGQEHIASVVNTLVLAYAGASLPLFLLITLPSAQPLWVTLNGEFIAQEVVRTLVGSMALILAVPISTYLASKYLVGKR